MVSVGPHAVEASAPASPRFHSILFRDPTDEPTGAISPVGHFADLRLDDILAALAGVAHSDALTRHFTTPLRDATAVAYRHEVFTDLAHADVLAAIKKFSDAMDARHQVLEQVQRARHRLQQQSLSLELLATYADAARTLASDLQALHLGSTALRSLRAALEDLVHSPTFIASAATLATLQNAGSAVRYTVRIQGSRVIVSRYDGQGDHGAEVRSIFARFRHDTPGATPGVSSDSLRVDAVESRILDGVAVLHPELFAARDAFLAGPDGRMDPLITRLHHELPFYLSWLGLIRPLQHAGLTFCLPQVTENTSEISVEDGFDLALALATVPTGAAVVCNSFRLSGPEQIVVVTGPNNGGKTTFARMVGQLFHLVGLGVPVPGRSARLTLPDVVFTHFEQEEGAPTLTGRFLDELQRVHTILREATRDSVVILNESFSSTNLRDAVTVATEVMETLLERGCVGVYVTFMDELAALDDRSVSMVPRVVPQDPATRTFILDRAPADGRAHAWAIAQKYGLTRESLLARMRP
ncbi:MutS-related protein [Tessaracoccus antarcticus]|nr:hypothetical protein [Tessaracoccus antarcticus]